MSRSKAEIAFAGKLKADLEEDFICNVRGLPGTPDIVFKNYKLVIFFNGCYWHSHHCRTKTKSLVWRDILKDQKTRDTRVISQLKHLGYEALTVWECEWNSNPSKIIEYIKGRLYFSQFLSRKNSRPESNRLSKVSP